MTENPAGRRLMDRWWARGLLLLVLCTAIGVLIRGGNVAAAAISATGYAAYGTWQMMRRRRRDSRAVGADAAELPLLERRMRHGDLPADPEERRVMRALAQRRLAQMNRSYAKWAFVLLAVIVAGLSALQLAAGHTVPGICTLLLGAAFLGWMFLMRRRNQARLTRVSRRLDASQHGQPA
jgi:Flp pilus assembly protein TadB